MTAKKALPRVLLAGGALALALATPGGLGLLVPLVLLVVLGYLYISAIQWA